MKKLLCCTAALCLSVYLHAQSSADSAMIYNISSISYPAAKSTIVAALQAANPADTSEGGDVNEFLRRAAYREMYRNPTVDTGADMFAGYRTAMFGVMAHADAYCTGSGGAWQCLGPFNNSYGGSENQGRADAVWVSPANDSIMLVATYGGLWKSTNAGHSWHNISDNVGTGYGSILIPGTMAITSLAVDPLNNNIIHVFLADLGGTNMGAAYTTDGGNSWQEDTSFNNIAGYTVFINALPNLKMMYMPGTEKLFAFVNNTNLIKSSILMKAGASAPWTNITPALGADSIVGDMEFMIAHPGKVVFSTNAADYTAHLWTYDTLAGWSNLAVTLSLPDSITGIGSFSFSSTDSIFMLIGVKGAGEQVASTPYNLSSVHILNRHAYDTIDGGTFQYILVSPNNTNVIYTSDHNAYNNFYQSTDGGASFSSIQGATHADGRYFTIYTPATYGGGLYDDVLYGTTDGGVVMKPAGSAYFQSITGDSLCITEFYGMSNQEDGDDSLILGGAQDNGGISYNKGRAAPWVHDIDGDNFYPKFMRYGVKQCFAEGDWISAYNETPALYKDYFAGTTETHVQINNPLSYQYPNSYAPWYISPSNTAYIGINWVWKYEPDSSAWRNAFAANPTFAYYPEGYDLCGIIMAEPDTNMVYLAYGGTAIDSTIRGDYDKEGRLFRSYNAFSTNILDPVDWYSITPDIVKQYAIQAIETDPNNFGRIWVALRGVNIPDLSLPPSQAQGRMYYSPDTGNTWYDVSSGLPALNITAVKYRHGSNDDLYAGTAVGVYRCDFSAFNPSDPPYYGITWTCFNNGMPVLAISQMEFNYCANKLRVASFGRGIWETPLDNINIRPDSNTTITATTTWTTDQYLENSVVIKPGATLNVIGCTVHMPKNGAIVVAAGAHLNVNGSTITNDCAQCMWKGIQLEGAATGTRQSVAGDGWVTITNGSIIEHARAGVANYDIWNYGGVATGGACQVNNGSSFIDDSVAVSLLNFHNINTFGAVLPNLSNFSNCSFIWDNNYKGDASGQHVTNLVNLGEVEGIPFTGCQFLNQDTSAGSRLRGNGIYAVSAGFSVGPACPPHTICVYPSVLSRFSGFINGIDILGVTNADPTISIDQTTFDSVCVGVNATANNNVSVTRSNFTVGHGLGEPVLPGSGLLAYGCYQNIGILQQSAAQFWIEGNSFKGIAGPTDWYNFGTVVSNINIGSYIAETTFVTDNIYRNVFDSLTTGVCAIGKNRNILPYTQPGLVISCDSFSANATAIGVTSDGDVSYGSHYEGIDIDQLPGGFDAGNKYNGSTNSLINTSGTGIQFFYRSPLTEWPHSGTISGMYSPIIVDSANACPSTLPPLGILGYYGSMSGLQPMAARRTHRMAFTTSQTIFTDTLAVLNKLVDFGNTDSLLRVVDTSTSSTALFATFSLLGPYISETVLETAADSMRLTYPGMVTILTNVPDDSRDSVFLAYVNNDYHFTPGDLGTIQAASLLSTRRTAQQNTINAAGASMSYEANVVMMMLKSAYDTSVALGDTTGAGICTDSTSVYYGLDSNAAFVGLDSADQMLQNIGGMWTGFARVGLYHFLAQDNVADSILSSMNGLIGIPALPSYSYDSAIYGRYTSLWNVIYSADTAGRDLFSLDSAGIAALDTTSYNVAGYSAPQMMVVNVSNTYSQINFVEVMPCIDLLERKNNPNGENSGPGNYGGKTPAAAGQFSVFPNPSSSMVTFAWNSPGSDGVTITVTDLLGGQVMLQKASGSNGAVQWNPAVAAGVYIYQASNTKGIIGIGKIVLIGKQ